MQKPVSFLFAAVISDTAAVSGAEPAATNATPPVANSTAGNPAVFPLVILALVVPVFVVLVVLAFHSLRKRPVPKAPELPTVLFHPSAQEGKDPDGFEVIETPVDGAIIMSHLFRNPDADDGDVVIFFHGNEEIAEHWFPYAREISNAFKANLLLVDYRGYGQSTGDPTYRNMLSDAEAVFEAVGAEFSRFGQVFGRRARRVHVFGRSIGSAAAIHVAWKYGDNVASLVVDSGFAHLPALIERLGRGSVPPPGLPEGFLDNADKLRNIRIPTLFLHGVEDSLIPIEVARENFAAAASSEKQLAELPGAGHNDTVLSRGYFEKIGEFLKPQIENLEKKLKECGEKYPYGRCPICGMALDQGSVCYSCIAPLPPNHGTMPVAPWSADAGVSFEWHGAGNDNDLLVLFQWQPKTEIERRLSSKPETDWSVEETKRMRIIQANQFRYVATVSIFRMLGSHRPLRIFTIERSIYFTTIPLFCEWREDFPGGRRVHGPYTGPEEENAVLDFFVGILSQGKSETIKRIGSVEDGWKLKNDRECDFIDNRCNKSVPARFIYLHEDATRIFAPFNLEVQLPERWAGQIMTQLPYKFEMGCDSAATPSLEDVPFCALNLEDDPRRDSCSRRYIRFTQIDDCSGFLIELLADNLCTVAGVALKKGERAVAKPGDEIAIAPNWVFKVVPRK